MNEMILLYTSYFSQLTHFFLVTKMRTREKYKQKKKRNCCVAIEAPKKLNDDDDDDEVFVRNGM
jgi:hypothetical protein